LHATLYRANFVWANLENASVNLWQLMDMRNIKYITMMGGIKYENSWIFWISKAKKPILVKPKNKP
jgi:hypothetical protein